MTNQFCEYCGGPSPCYCQMGNGFEQSPAWRRTEDFVNKRLADFHSEQHILEHCDPDSVCSGYSYHEPGTIWVNVDTGRVHIKGWNSWLSLNDFEGAKEDLEKKINQHSAGLSIRYAELLSMYGEQKDKVAKLMVRVESLEMDAANTITVEPIAPSNEHPDGPNVLVCTDESLDKLLWPIFDNSSGLRKAGGFYDLSCVSADTKRNIMLDDVVASALRWCETRTKLFSNVRYWVRPIETTGTLIIQRNRFLFQFKNPPESALVSGEKEV